MRSRPDASSSSVSRCFLDALPTELLGEVFKLSLPNNALVEATDGCPEPYTESDAPRSLQTCQRWRNLSIATPVLWASIFIEIDQNETITPPLDVIEIWLQRSRSQPLFIALYVQICASSIVSTHTDQVLNVLMRHLPRWKCAHLYLNCESVPSSLQDEPHATPSALTTVEIDFADAFEALQTVAYIIHPAECVHLFNDLYADTALEWLEACINVRDFEISSINPCPDDLDNVRNSNLRTLTFRQVRNNLDNFLIHLTLPALEAVNINCSRPHITFAHGLGHLVQHSRCDLKHLMLNNTSLLEDELITLFHLIPSLRLFELRTNSTPCIQDKLIDLVTAGTILPRLQILSLGANTLECADGALGRMVRARRPYTLPSGADISSAEHLQVLDLSFNKTWLHGRPDDRAAFELAVVGGLCIEFNGTPISLEL